MRTRVPLVAAFVVIAAAALPAVAAADGGWQSPDSIAGLGGSYTRPALGGAAGVQLQTGTFGALANNPAIGAFLVFNDDKGNFRDAFPIIALKRDPLGKTIVALELGDARDGSTFVLVRVGL